MINFSKVEEKILAFWDQDKTFEKSLAKKSPKGNFVFFEGPPTANGRPGIHHVLARIFKDIILRYKTMQGYFVERKAGWDTQGLPVELEVEKLIGVSGKPDIEKYGVAKFNEKCKESVWKYKKEWEEMTRRIGFWLDLEHPYITYEKEYIETLWWIFKQVWQKNLVYQAYKVVPYCPRCGTTLSSHEVAQGYKNVKEESVYLKLKVKGQDNTYLLVWTTTPWTLPSNLVVAAGERIEYVKAKSGNDYYILAKNLVDKVLGGHGYEIVEEFKGDKVVGLEYEPMYYIYSDPSYFKVYAADFVSIEDGTGMVHIAPHYGEEDCQLFIQHKLPIPELLTLDLQGKLIVDVPGKGRFAKDADKDIMADLKQRGILFGVENYAHDYPFCWRCDSPLLYYSRKSWFIKMSALQQDLLKNAEQINWIPVHIKEGRFGEWLGGIKDWAISRERYWGTPIPIWTCEKCDEKKIVGDYEELGVFKKLNNVYYLVRHGQAECNDMNLLNSNSKDDRYHLTQTGRKQIELVAQKIKNEGIDVIINSPFLRAKETTEIISKTCGVKTEESDLVREVGLGQADGKTIDDLIKLVGTAENQTLNGVPGGEKPEELIARLKEFINQTEKKYKNKKIAIVSHGDPITRLISLFSGKDILSLAKEANYPKVGSIYRFDRISTGGEEFDPHKPFIDEFTFTCNKCGGKMKRVPEVMDCWFDSGAMPFAQWHYPFANKEKIDQGINYPAEYISEAIDQTRGWFYTLLAISTFLDKGTCYKNVICLGHILDKKGQKMSKHVGNVIAPMTVINEYGVDALRWYLYTVNQAGESKLFDTEGVKKVVQRMLLTLWNCLDFYKLVSGNKAIHDNTPEINNVLDKWLLAKYNLLVKNVTEKLDKYDIATAGRDIESFITELSQWYIRRSRDRFKKSPDASHILGHVLLGVAKLLAPFTPFISDEIYQQLTGRKESIHLVDWPAVNESLIDEKIIEQMKSVVDVCALAHAVRSLHQIKVRQPLADLEILQKNKLPEELLEIIKEETNVKEIIFVDKLTLEKTGGVADDGERIVAINPKITPELKAEGQARELVRQINSFRKEAKLTIQDKIDLYYQTDNADLKNLLEKGDKIKTDTLSNNLIAGQPKEIKFTKEAEVDGAKIKLFI